MNEIKEVENILKGMNEIREVKDLLKSMNEIRDREAHECV